MKQENIDCLLKGIESAINPNNPDLSFGEKEKLKKVKIELEKELNISIDPQVVANIIQAIAIIMEIMKEVSPHLK